MSLYMVILRYYRCVDPRRSRVAGLQRRLVIEAKQLTRQDRTQKRHKRIRNKVCAVFSPAVW